MLAFTFLRDIHWGADPNRKDACILGRLFTTKPTNCCGLVRHGHLKTNLDQAQAAHMFCGNQIIWEA